MAAEIPSIEGYDINLIDGINMPFTAHKEHLDQVKDFPYDDTDIVIATYPKSGQTWVRKIIEYLKYDGDLEDVKKFNLKDVFFPIEAGPDPSINNVQIHQQMAPPRHIKTHLYADYFTTPLENGKAKFVVVMRNVKDVLVSFYCLLKIVTYSTRLKKTWDEFFTDIVQKDLLLMGSWFYHVKSWWNYKHLPNVHIIKYEDLLKDLPKEITKLAAFLEINVTEFRVKEIAECCTFDTFRENANEDIGFKMDGSFFRKGKAGDWKNYFTEEQNQYIDNLYENTFKDTDFTIDFDVEEN